MPTLIEAQTEKVRLAALAAERELAQALAATRSADVLHAAALGVRRLLLAAIDQLPDMLADAIAGEHEETRVHYLLSDAIYQLLDTLGKRAETHSAALPEFGERIRYGSRPRDLLTVSQWADRHRRLESGTNSPGQWRTSLTPYLRDILDDLSEHSPVRVVAFKKSSGVGGTEVIFCWLGYIMHHLANKDVLVVVPTLELRDRSFNPRLSKMFDETPAIGELVSKASRNRANRADIIEYGARARIIKAGANSPDSLRMDHLPYAICDEIDAYPWDVGGEGDPLTLIENRQRTFSRRKSFYLSTPTSEDASHIDSLYQRSDRRRYHVPCPHCGEHHILTIEHLKYRIAAGDGAADEKEVTDAWMVCPHCGAEIREGDKTAMLADGRWVAERPHLKRVRGYHLNALYAPIGLGSSWSEIAQKWREAQSDTAKLKAFHNTFLGEIYREEGEGADAVQVQARVEAYDPRAPLPGVWRITAGVDVQKDRLEVSVVGWGAGEESWLLDHVILPGDTAQPQVWLDLESEFAAWRPSLAAIDAGYNTSMVLDFCAKRAWCVPVKGVFGVGRPLIEDERRRKARLRTRRKRGQPIEPLGVDQGKSLLYGRLKMVKPGPGFVHCPAEEAFDDEYFLQLTAEELVKRARSGRTFMEWKKIRPRNEALDCWIYALAACRLAGPLVERTPAPYRAPEAKNDALPPDVIHGIQPAEKNIEPTPPPPQTRKKRAVAQRSGGAFSLRY